MSNYANERDVVPEPPPIDWESSSLFKRVVDIAAKDNDGFLIQNHGTGDALYLCEVLLETAKNGKHPVTLVSGKLYMDFYNRLKRKLEEVIDAGCSFKAYLVDAKHPDGGTKNDFATLLLEKEKDDSEKYSLRCEELSKEKTIPQVLLVGENGEAFRFEKDPQTHAALAAFGGLKSASPVGNELAQFVKKRLEEEFPSQGFR